MERGASPGRNTSGNPDSSAVGRSQAQQAQGGQQQGGQQQQQQQQGASSENDAGAGGAAGFKAWEASNSLLLYSLKDVDASAVCNDG